MSSEHPKQPKQPLQHIGPYWRKKNLAGQYAQPFTTTRGMVEVYTGVGELSVLFAMAAGDLKISPRELSIYWTALAAVVGGLARPGWSVVSRKGVDHYPEQVSLEEITTRDVREALDKWGIAYCLQEESAGVPGKMLPGQWIISSRLFEVISTDPQNFSIGQKEEILPRIRETNERDPIPNTGGLMHVLADHVKGLLNEEGIQHAPIALMGAVKAALLEKAIQVSLT